MFWTILLVLVIIYLSYRVFIKPMYYWHSSNVDQCITAPLFGDQWKMFFKIESFADMVRRTYTIGKGRYFGTYQMMTPTLMLRDPELITQITIKDFDHFTDRYVFIPTNSEPLLNKMLFTLKGDEWRDMRSILSPAFTGSKMRAMFTLMNDCSQQYCKHYLELKEDKIVMEIKDSLTRFTNDVIATCAFGITCNSLKEPENEFYMMAKEATNFKSAWKILKFFIMFLSPTISKILKIAVFDESVLNFFKSVIKDTIQTREEQNIIRPDMINLLLEAKKGRLKHDEETFNKDTGFATVEESYIGKTTNTNKNEITDLDITAQAFIFFVAGFDSVATLMSFMAFELAVNPDVQEKLKNEIKETREACKGKLDYDHLNKMKYMDMVISESLRKWPVAVATDRICVKPYTIEPKCDGESPVHIKIGDIVWLPMFGLHYDPEIYPNPDSFNPDRFNDDNKYNIKQNTYIPFGIGPRNCIGSRFALMEIKTVFYYILQHFDITVVEKSVVPIRADRKQFGLFAEGGFWLGLNKNEL